MLYPIGIQNFEDLRKNEYVYVDKTLQLHRLVSTGKYSTLTSQLTYSLFCLKILAPSRARGIIIGSRSVWPAEGLAILITL